MEFRTLKPQEIDCRIGGIYNGGFTLLLYKDARVDQDILDETVGRENWQRDHKEIKGTVYGGVGIYNTERAQQGLDPWAWKWDAGAESYTEKEKGEASDAFKRACVNWGIGRELYSAPFIWIKAETYQDNNNRWKLKNSKDGRGFYVGAIEYSQARKITYLSIVKSDKVVFSYGGPKTAQNESQEHISLTQASTIEGLAMLHGKAVEDILKAYKIRDLTELNQVQYSNIVRRLENG